MLALGINLDEAGEALRLSGLVGGFGVDWSLRDPSPTSTLILLDPGFFRLLPQWDWGFLFLASICSILFFSYLETHVHGFGAVYSPVLFLIAVWAHEAIGLVATFDCPFVVEFLCL